MAQFIRLTERHGDAKVIMQVGQIASIRDLRTDKAVAGDFNFTCIVCGGRGYEVKETEAEILEKIGINI